MLRICVTFNNKRNSFGSPIPDGSQWTNRAALRSGLCDLHATGEPDRQKTSGFNIFGRDFSIADKRRADSVAAAPHNLDSSGKTYGKVVPAELFRIF